MLYSPRYSANRWQLVQFSKDMWGNCTLTRGFQMLRPILRSKADVTGFEAVVTLLVAAQCQHPKLLSGHGMMPWTCSLPFKKRTMWLDCCSIFLDSIHITLTVLPKLTYGVRLAVRSAGKSPPLSLSTLHPAYQAFWLSHSYSTSILSLLDKEHIPLLQVGATLVHVQSNHRFGSRSRH